MRNRILSYFKRNPKRRFAPETIYNKFGIGWEVNEALFELIDDNYIRLTKNWRLQYGKRK
jgi:hypothetical protein